MAEGKYSLHHEFSVVQTKEDEKTMKIIFEFVKERQDIINKENLSNIVTGEEIENEKNNFLLNFEQMGKEIYKEFPGSRLIEKTKGIFDAISKPLFSKQKASEQNIIDQKKEYLKFTQTVDIARTRGFDVKKLLQYQITSTSLFVSQPNGNLRTSKGKFALLKEIKMTIAKPQLDKNFAVFIDFMAHARKVTSKNYKLRIKTFGDWMNQLWESFLALCGCAERIDIVFDLYLTSSHKDSATTWN